MEAGLDSIGAVEVRNALASKYGVEVPATVTFDYPTAEALAGFVLSRASVQAKASQASLSVNIFHHVSIMHAYIKNKP